MRRGSLRHLLLNIIIRQVSQLARQLSAFLGKFLESGARSPLGQVLHYFSKVHINLQRGKHERRTDGERVHKGSTREETVGQHLARSVRNRRKQVVPRRHLIPIHDRHDRRRSESVHTRIRLDATRRGKHALRSQVHLHVLGGMQDVLGELVNLVQLDITVAEHGGLIQCLMHRLSMFAPRRSVRDEPDVELPSHPNAPSSVRARSWKKDIALTA